MVVILAETVEKPKIHKYGACKLLISFHAKLLKSPFLDFFDSLPTYRKWPQLLIPAMYL